MKEAVEVVDTQTHPVVKIIVNRNEQSQVLTDGNEVRSASVTFTFNPDDVECVRTRDRSWLIRDKKS